MEDEQAVSVEYVVTREEFMAFARWQIWSMKGLRLNAGLTTLAVIGGILLIATGSNVAVGAILLALCALEIALGAWVAISVTRRSWAKRGSTVAATYLRFSPDGVYVRTASTDEPTPWSTYPRTIEYRDLYLLEVNRLVYRVIPKRAFDNASDEQRFRELVAAHTTAVLKTPKGQ